MTLFAYIDPATTSALLYVVVGAVASLVYACRGWFYRIRDLILSRSTGKSSADGAPLVFYSEGRQYWPVFAPVLAELDKRGVVYLFITSDSSDPGLVSPPGNRLVRCVSQALTAPCLNHLRAKVVVMTTPQIDVLTLRRSPHVRHYVHLVHAPTDFFTYRKFAFDHFDTVMTAGPHQIRTARRLEEIRGYPPKKLLETGCTYYDGLMAELESRKATGETHPHAPSDLPVLLVAPTWKPYGFLNRYGIRLLRTLLDTQKYRIIFRPHPQTAISFPEILEEVRKTFESHPLFELDVNPDGTASLDRADLMISELSGIVFDFAFTRGRPTLIYNGEPDLRGFEAEDLDIPMWELAVRSQVGTEFGTEDIPNLPVLVQDLLQNRDAKNLAAFRDENIYNFGHAGPVAAKQILEILESVPD